MVTRLVHNDRQFPCVYEERLKRLTSLLPVHHNSSASLQCRSLIYFTKRE